MPTRSVETLKLQAERWLTHKESEYVRGSAGSTAGTVSEVAEFGHVAGSACV